MMRSKQLFVGLISEGTTDTRFLYSVIDRTINELIFRFGDSVEIYMEELKKDSGKSFVEQIIDASINYQKENHINFLLVHSDADYLDDSIVQKNKFNPLYKGVEINSDLFCKDIVPIIPVYMIEAWMLADFDLFVDEISTSKSKTELQLNGHPESFTNPKEKIKKALNIINDERPKKRRKELQISDLYQIIGQKIEIEKLKSLKSFEKFYNNLIETLENLHFIHTR